VVSQSGSSFVCIAAQTGQQPPSDAWDLLAASGAPGEQGQQGAQGPQGPQGAAGQSPTLSWGTGTDADRIEINGTASGPHLTGPQGPQGLQGPQGPSGPPALSGTVTRNGTTGLISSVALTGGPTYTLTRTNGLISSLSDGTHTWTLSRDGNGQITGWSVA
jgi:hypothetical protein